LASRETLSFSIDSAAAARCSLPALTSHCRRAIHRLDVLYTSSGHRKEAAMVNGAHAILYSDDADATRATLAKALGTRSVDAGGG
jgi:hypothetical protein